MTELKRQLEDLNLGKSIAELDDLLYTSYVESSTFNEFINDRYDIICGSKGTGKSALLLYIYGNKSLIDQLADVVLVKANEHQGDPSFKRSFASIESNSVLDVYVEAWKIYIINLIWAELSNVLDSAEELETYLMKKNILTKDKGFLGKLLFAVTRAKLSITIEDIEYGFQAGDDLKNSSNFVDYNYIFNEIENILNINDKRVWVLLDRLDDAFPDWSESSQKAIKSLFYVYKELLGYKKLKLKTFIRTDLFDRITILDGFTSLSHIKALTSAPIIWDESSIKKFITNRFHSIYGNMNEDEIIKKVLGDKIDAGKNKPDSFHWMLNHLTDGNAMYTPRDILDFLDTAREYTLREIEQSGNNVYDSSLFSKNALKKAWPTVSANKMQSQIYAENPELRDSIELFRGGKAEYSNEKIESLLGLNHKSICDQLRYIGFLGKYGKNWKVPFLHRPYLNIKQGKS